MQFQSSQDLTTRSSKQVTHAFLHPQPAGSFFQVCNNQLLALEKLTAIFKGALMSHKSNTTSPQVEIIKSDTTPRVQITVSPMRVPNKAKLPIVVQPTVTRIATPNSHRRLNPTPCKAVTPSTPHPMMWRSVKLCNKPIMLSLCQLGQPSKEQKVPPRLHQ
jgi:hypothetical protein